MKKKLAVVVGLIATLLVATTGIALAVSDGVYSYEKQHCSGRADNYRRPDHTEEGCHNATVVLSDGNDNEWFSAGLKQTPDGTSVDPTDPDIAFDPAGGDPST